jgi:general nucleoside transport system ATP-binding protein
VLRGGKVTGEVDPTQESNASLSRLMIGAEPPRCSTAAAHAGRRGAAVQGCRCPRPTPSAWTLHDIVASSVRAGEILGVAGVSGNGQQELMAALSGEDRARRPAASALRPGHHRRHSRAAPPAGPALRARGAPGPRRRAHAEPGAEHAAHAHRGVARGGWICAGARARAGRAADRALPGQGRRARRGGRSLSGGNLQKFIVGREIDAKPKLLIVSQPTWGVDVGAAALIRGELLALRDAGCALLVVSEELDELFEISDRLSSSRRGGCRRMPRRGHGGADRRVDERAVGAPARGASRSGGGRHAAA